MSDHDLQREDGAWWRGWHLQCTCSRWTWGLTRRAAIRRSANHHARMARAEARCREISP